jgi:prolyl oligopeptidase
VLRYPTARKLDQTDLYHGTAVRDPYRWMERLDDPDLPAWLAAEAAITEEVLSGAPCREAFRSRLRELNQVDVVGVPRQFGPRWFQSRGEQIVRMDDGAVVFDGTKHPDGVVIGDVEISPDGTKVLWAETKGGSDWRTWRVRDIESGELLRDEVDDAKLWARWLPDGTSFVYIAFPSAGSDRSRPTTSPQLRLHRLGTDPSDDELLYEDAADPRYFFPQVTEDGRHLVLTLLMAPGAGIAYAPIEEPSSFTRLFTISSDLWFVGSRDDTFYVCTTEDAPYGRIVAVDLADGLPESWRTVVAESDAPLPLVARSMLVGDWVFVAREFLGRSIVRMVALDGSDSYDVDLPEWCRFVMADVGAAVGAASDGSSFYFGVTSPRSPMTVLHHDVATRVTRTEFTASVGSPVETVSEVVWTTSRDGTRVPMTLLRNAALPLDAPAVVVEGYGGAGDSAEPFDFVPWKLAWLEAGGVVASAHIRGGGELGAEWQSAAARGGKRKAMEDFVGCARWLASSGYTTPARICVTGRSSGAMLAAAAVIDSPDAFGACVAEVGMFDPLRYHLFGLGSLMIAEYGTSDDPADFRSMYSYSPYHNVREGSSYPAFLLTVHTDDDRVAPGGGYKFIAALQAAQRGDAPILLRTQRGLGHHWGPGAPGAVDERADILTFMGMTLGLPGC